MILNRSTYDMYENGQILSSENLYEVISSLCKNLRQSMLPYHDYSTSTSVGLLHLELCPLNIAFTLPLTLISMSNTRLTKASNDLG
jgi:hypothetical protein